MSKAEKGNKPSSKKGNNNFFKDTFGKKKITVRELRGGTAKEGRAAFKKKREEERNENFAGNAEKRFSKKERPERKGSASHASSERRPFDKKQDRFKDNASSERRYNTPTKKFVETIKEEMPLNKYIAHSGICSRREAADIVKQGKVKVNGELVIEPGYKVQPSDTVVMAGKKLRPIKDLVYLLLNKPKDFVTTTSDPEGRKTVMDLVASAGVPRLYPVGRLDRNTTGVLLITNDGTLAQKLSHPKYNVKKIYQVGLDKPITKEHFTQLTEGIVLEDGMAKADNASLLGTAQDIGLEIHSGRNRIVRRMFEALGYDVVKLDRVMYAGLTKKNVPRGKWRLLTEKEIVFLKHFKP